MAINPWKLRVMRIHVSSGSRHSPLGRSSMWPSEAGGLGPSQPHNSMIWRRVLRPVQPFLWVLKIPGVCSTATMESTLHAISDLLPPGFLARVEGRAFIYSGWAPQQEILKHPATAGFLTHCVWNSTLESASAGVPMLTWPLAAEQQLTARFLVDTSRLAIEIEKADKGFYKQEIETGVRRLFSEGEGGPLRKRVKEMSCSATHSASKQNVVKYMDELQTFKH